MAARQPAKKAAPAKKPAKRVVKEPAPAAKPRFGRPGTAGKASGDDAVQAWIAGVKPEHRPIVERLDALIGKTVPGVQRAVKWSMPMYGVKGQGWIAHLGSFKEHVALGFFSGSSLNPPPPEGEGKGMRRINIHGMQEFDEKRFRSWLEQAAALPGWGKA